MPIRSSAPPTRPGSRRQTNANAIGNAIAAMMSKIVRGAPVRLTSQLIARLLIVRLLDQFLLRIISAGVAGAEDLEIMTDLPEAVLLGNGIGPPFDRRSGYLDRATTYTADEMMVMMTCRTSAVRGLALVGADGVEFTGIGHELQSAIDRGEADAFAVMS
jgi:hypothetical protein